MAILCDLVAAGIIEKDKNNDVLWTWSYPSVTQEQREFLIEKSSLGSEQPLNTNFIYLQWQQTWFYVHIFDVESDGESALPEISQFALVLFSKDFNPEKYLTLCRLLGEQYKQSGSPLSMLKAYLSVVTLGVCGTNDNGKFKVSDFSQREAFSHTCVKDIIQTFGVETILIYTAMMLKKRIAVYMPKHSVGQLLDYTRSFPALAWHRQDWSVLHPLVSVTSRDLQDVTSSGHYVIGCTEAGVEGRQDLWDLLVDVPNATITTASHAKEYFAMGKLHKDLASLMIQKAEDDTLTDDDVIREIAAKTSDLLGNLRSLATEDPDGSVSVTLEQLKHRKMPPATENFLFSLAACEGLVKF